MGQYLTTSLKRLLILIQPTVLPCARFLSIKPAFLAQKQSFDHILVVNGDANLKTHVSNADSVCILFVQYYFIEIKTFNLAIY